MIEKLMKQFGISEEHAIKIMQLDERIRKIKLAEMRDWREVKKLEF